MVADVHGAVVERVDACAAGCFAEVEAAAGVHGAAALVEHAGGAAADDHALAVEDVHGAVVEGEGGGAAAADLEGVGRLAARVVHVQRPAVHRVGRAGRGAPFRQEEAKSGS